MYSKCLPVKQENELKVRNGDQDDYGREDIFKLIVLAIFKF